LFVLTENQAKFLWIEQCQQAFDKLKQTLTAAPLLSFPLGERKIYTRYGCVRLREVQKQEKTEKVVAYFRVLSKAERNYCVTRRELLAIKYFHHYLYGRRFLIRTDYALLSG